MKIELSYTDKEAIKIFESYGLSVENDTILGTETIHSSVEVDTEERKLVVINPTTKERVPLQKALHRLINRKMITDLLWMDKMEILDALNCVAPHVPFSEITKEVE